MVKYIKINKLFRGQLGICSYMPLWRDPTCCVTSERQNLVPCLSDLQKKTKIEAEISARLYTLDELSITSPESYAKRAF